MNLILIKMFATALALAQVTTRPESLKIEFDPVNDQAEVVQLLKDGCAHMRKAFDIEDLNLDTLIDTAMSDPQTVAGEIRAFRGINFDELAIAYKQFCGNGQVENSPFEMKPVIEFYNSVASNLPDHNRLKNLKLPGTSTVLDIKGEKFAELFESDHRRTWVPLRQIPEYVQLAFVAAEDKRFYQHKGIDERGLIRAFITNIAEPGRPQGGSTITQQVAKNLVTTRLLDGGIDKDPTKSLEQICGLALEAKIYPECMKNYPFILGAQALRMIDLAGFYAAIANEGQRVSPYTIDTIEKNGQAVYRHDAGRPVIMASGDRAAFFQLRTILEGVVTRGTAAAMKHLTGFAGGKTGTTDNENDAWFAGFTSDVTVVVWVGYDNARGKQTLGRGGTGGQVAVPIVEQIMQAAWNLQSPKAPLPPPSAEAARYLKPMPIDLNSGQKLASAKNGGFTEYFRLDGNKKLRDTQYALAGRHSLARSGPMPAPAANDDRPPPQQGITQRPNPMDRMPRTLRELFRL